MAKALQFDPLLDNLEAKLSIELEHRRVKQPTMIGIHSGGIWVAEKLHARLALREPLGRLNISFYRDDFSQIGVHPRVKPSNLPGPVDARDIILVDDVLHTGRTIRAALNEIFDYGRPAQVILAILLERNGRQLPIQADCVGEEIRLEANQSIKLSGPEPLSIGIYKR